MNIGPRALTLFLLNEIIINNVVDTSFDGKRDNSCSFREYVRGNNMAKRMEFKKQEKESWLDEMGEEEFVSFSDYIGKDIEISHAFTYVGKEGTKTAGKTGFTARFKACGTDKFVYSTSFGTAVVRQGAEIIEALKAGESVVVHVASKVSKNGNAYVYFE